MYLSSKFIPTDNSNNSYNLYVTLAYLELKAIE